MTDLAPRPAGTITYVPAEPKRRGAPTPKMFPWVYVQPQGIPAEHYASLEQALYFHPDAQVSMSAVLRMWRELSKMLEGRELAP